MAFRLNSAVMLVAALLGIAPLTAAAADEFPNKPIRFLVPYPPGGGNDVVARTVAQKLSENIGQPVVIDNKPGGSGMVAGDILAKAPPDGYTIMVDHSAIVVNPALYPNITYDVRQLSPITMAVTIDNLLLVNPSLPVNSVAELIALAKAQPGKLNYASTGGGGPQHMAMEQFKGMAGLDIVHVPYKGGAPATLATLGGEVQMLFISVSTGLPHIKAGKLRALATAAPKRNALLPELPTVAESGLPGYENIAWLGIFAPPKTPPAIVAKLNAEFVKALNSKDVRDRFAQGGIDVVASTPEALGKVVNEEVARYSKIVKEANIKAD
jgi:tripartite-type tricarboxylate transporter receptor subunit TctC